MRIFYIVKYPDTVLIDPGTQADDRSLSTPAGEIVSFREHGAGKPSVLIFRATWRPLCRRYMPEPDKLLASLPEGFGNVYALNVNAITRGEAAARRRYFGNILSTASCCHPLTWEFPSATPFRLISSARAHDLLRSVVQTVSLGDGAIKRQPQCQRQNLAAAARRLAAAIIRWLSGLSGMADDQLHPYRPANHSR